MSPHIGKGRFGVIVLPAAVDALVLHLDGFRHRLLVCNIVERGAEEVFAVVDLGQNSSDTFFVWVLVGVVYKDAVRVLDLVDDIFNRLHNTSGRVFIFRLDPVGNRAVRIGVDLHWIDLAPA